MALFGSRPRSCWVARAELPATLRGVTLAFALLGFGAACGDAAGPHGSAKGAVGARPVAGPVVAKVNGESIGLDEVRDVCAASGLPPETALARLIDERVLAQYAEARGYGDRADTQTELSRARVRALLEQGVEAAQPTEQGRRERLDKLLQELRAKTKVVYDEKAVSQALSDDGTLGPGT